MKSYKRPVVRGTLVVVCAVALGVGVVRLAISISLPLYHRIAHRVEAAAIAAIIDEGYINLNAASVSQLQSLPGIGPVLAQRIIDYRLFIGGYSHEAELLRVMGIGDKTAESLYPLVYVGEMP